MTWADLLRAAVANTRRAGLRAGLTVLAVFIGALALTLTSGMGTGVNRYIDETVAAFGTPDTLYVQRSHPLVELSSGSGPRPWEPGSSRVQTGLGVSFEGLTPEDVALLEGLEHVASVEPMYSVTPSWLETPGGERFQLPLGIPVDVEGLRLVAGRAPDPGRDELSLPGSWVAGLGFASPQEAVGARLEVVMEDVAGRPRAFPATVSGVTQASLAGTALNPIPSASFNERLHAHQVSGGPQPVPESYLMATVSVPDLGRIGAVQDRLEDEGMVASTVEDKLGMFRAVINGIVWILNTSAVVALLAAGLGIVNTLLMSVQERTREIGLMKAVGMGGHKVFGLFSLEAVVIGFLGAVAGASAGVLAGTAASDALAAGPLARLPGLSLFAFEGDRVLLIVAAVVGIAFLAGTLPAVRAARKDPIEALRHE